MWSICVVVPSAAGSMMSFSTMYPCGSVRRCSRTRRSPAIPRRSLPEERHGGKKETGAGSEKSLRAVAQTSTGRFSSLSPASGKAFGQTGAAMLSRAEFPTAAHAMHRLCRRTFSRSHPTRTRVATRARETRAQRKTLGQTKAETTITVRTNATAFPSDAPDRCLDRLRYLPRGRFIPTKNTGVTAAASRAPEAPPHGRRCPFRRRHRPFSRWSCP